MNNYNVKIALLFELYIIICTRLCMIAVFEMQGTLL